MIVIILRLLHIVGGVLWVGAAVFNAVLLGPAARAMGPAAGQLMKQLVQVRRMPLYMMGAAVATIASGFILMWRTSGGFGAEWMRTGTGMTFSTGAMFAIITLVYGMGFQSPTAKRLSALAGSLQGPPSPEQGAEMQRLQARLAVGGNVTAVLLVLATAAMAAARYVP